MYKPQLIVVGVDGGGFELIQPWLEAGDLPNINSMLQGGVSGHLYSCLPPVTRPNWKCYATGLNPGKLGMFWWAELDKQNMSFVHNAFSGNTESFWDILQDNGYQAGSINTPLTYNSHSRAKVLIAGGPDALDCNFCTSDRLERELISKIGYQVHPKHQNSLEKDMIYETLELINMRFKAAEYIMQNEQIDFLQITSFYINVLQHLYWNDDCVKEAWKIIDKWIGHYLDQGICIWVMSDHGSMPVDVEFSINSWLTEKGYIELVKTKSDLLAQLGINRKSVKSIIEKMGLKQMLRNRVPMKLRELIPDEEGRLVGQGGLNRIDKQRSSAFGLAQGPVYILNQENQKKQLIKKQLIEELKHVRHPEHGRYIAEDVLDAEVEYQNAGFWNAPDILIKYGHGIQITGAVGYNGSFMKPRRWKADNKQEGIFLAYGKDMATNTQIDLSILDLAPSILHYFGVDIPENMDGKIYKEVYSKESLPYHDQVQKTKHRVTDIDEQNNLSNVLEKRLQDLGYLK